MRTHRCADAESRVRSHFAAASNELRWTRTVVVAGVLASIGVAGAAPTPTPTVMWGASAAEVPALCRSTVGLPPIAQVPFTITRASTQCGGMGLTNPAPAPPYSGAVADGSGAVLDRLSLGCLYTGTLPGLVIPDGATSQLSVVGTSVLPPSVTLGGSPGHGAQDCTLGAGPRRACVNGDPGVDGTGTCTVDADCGGEFAAIGSCQLEAHCYFGPPIPVPNGGLSACVVNTFLTDLCGRVNLLPRQVSLTTALSSRVYFTANAASPCPRCESGVCNGGARAGLACTPVGSAQTSIDCPPPPIRFLGALTVALPSLTTGTATLTAHDGEFCANQPSPGAFGVADARKITETGLPPLASTNLLAMHLASTFCVPATGTFLDFVAQLPAAGALSAAGKLDLRGILP
jgi:hypothetical protein